MKVKQFFCPMINKYFHLCHEPSLFRCRGDIPDIEGYIQAGPVFEVEFEIEDLTKEELDARFSDIKKQQIEAQISALQKELTA